MRISSCCVWGLALGIFPSTLSADDVKKTEVYARTKAKIDAVSAINTHDHLMPFDKTGPREETDRGKTIILRSIWEGSYFPWIHSLEPWPKGGSFDA